MKNIETRVFQAEMRVMDEGTIEGYAAVFGQWSENLGGFREKIRQGAFAKTIQEADVRALFNHDPNYVLGRNRSGTLDLAEDEHGLQFRVRPPETGWATDLRESVKRGDIDQASFGFAVVRDAWGNESSKVRDRELIEVRLFDVSVVTYPAYPQTVVSARSLAEQFIEQVRENADPETIEFMRSELAALDQIAGSDTRGVETTPVQEVEAGDAPGLEPHPSTAELIRLRNRILKLTIPTKEETE